MKERLMKLREFCDLQNGYAFKSADYVENSNTLSCRMSNIRPDATFNILYNPKFLPDSYAIKYKDFLLQDGDVIVAMTDMATDPKILGVPTIVETKGFNLLLNQRVGKICKIDSNVINLEYLKRVLSRPELKYYYKKFSGGGLQLNISKDSILNIKIPVPSIEKQIRIVNILKKTEVLISQRKEGLQLLHEFLKSTFLEMFGDPSSNKKKFHLGTIRDVVTEVKYGTSSPAEDQGQYPYLRMNNITADGYMDLSNLKYINVNPAEREKYIVRKGDLLFNRTNSKELVGKTAVFNEDTEMIIAGYLIRLRTNEKANPWFLWGCLNSSHGKQTLLGMCKSIVGMANINAQELQRIKILLPPIEQQNAFARIVLKTEEIKAQYRTSLKELENLYGSLSQRAFNGELRPSE